ncbi:MAG: cytochrome P450 [Sinimarinibacterium sp.]
MPAELFWDHSLAEYTHELDDPFLAASRLHDGPDILWARDANFGQPGWILTRHALQQEAFMDHEHFSAERANLAPLLGVSWRLNPLEFDPPVHRTYRQILNPFFSPRAVSSLDEAVRQACQTLMTEFEGRDSCEFAHEFATPFPSYVFLALMGMPKVMLPQFLEWENTLLRGTDNQKRVVAARSILHYLEGFLAEQHKNPTTELMKGLLAARIEDRPLDDGELLGMIYLLYIGGLDTVYSALGWIMRHLAGDPSLQQRLRAHPEDIPRAVDEFTRAFAVAAPHRKVTKDFIFHGVAMRKGDDVHMPTYLATRDPREFENPHAVDLDRRTRHLGFATGPHLCLGVNLAKREIKTVLETVLARFNNIRMSPGETYEYHTGSVLGVDRLMLTWDRIC